MRLIDVTQRPILQAPILWAINPVRYVAMRFVQQLPRRAKRRPRIPATLWRRCEMGILPIVPSRFLYLVDCVIDLVSGVMPLIAKLMPVIGFDPGTRRPKVRQCMKICRLFSMRRRRRRKQQ